MRPHLLPSLRELISISGAMFCLAAGMLGAGCANTYAIKIDSLANARAADAISYQLHCTNPAVEQDSLRQKEAIGFIRTALSGKGLYETTVGEKPDIVVEFDVGVSSPQLHREMITELDYNNVTSNWETPVTTLNRVLVTTIHYEKHLRLSAHENKATGVDRPPVDVWIVDVTSEGENRDLRKALPILAAAAIAYVGKDSHGEKIIHLKDTDPDLAFIRKGM